LVAQDASDHFYGVAVYLTGVFSDYFVFGRSEL
jgi:hypothetical protein